MSIGLSPIVMAAKTDINILLELVAKKLQYSLGKPTNKLPFIFNHLKYQQGIWSQSRL